MPPRQNPESEPEEGISVERFPAEIQTMIFTEALNKPHVHFVFAGRVEHKSHGRTLAWSLKFNAKPAATDQSGYRLVNELSKVSHIAARAVRMATIEKARLPFTEKTHVIGNMDASTDLVCVEFEKARNWRNVRFAREHQFMPQIFLRDGGIAQLHGIRRVALVYDGHSTVFRCLHRHQVCRLCPDEALGFLDCFPDLEAVYVIVHWHPTKLDRASKDLIHAYRDRVFSLPDAERKAKGIEMFHSRTRSFIEVHPDLAETGHELSTNPAKKPVPHNWQVFNLLGGLKNVFNRPITNNDQYTMTPEQREKLKFKFLLETDRK